MKYQLRYKGAPIQLARPPWTDDELYVDNPAFRKECAWYIWEHWDGTGDRPSRPGGYQEDHGALLRVVNSLDRELSDAQKRWWLELIATAVQYYDEHVGAGRMP